MSDFRLHAFWAKYLPKIGKDACPFAHSKLSSNLKYFILLIRLIRFNIWKSAIFYTCRTDVPSTEQATDGDLLSKLANNFDSLQSDPCHRFDYDSVHQSMKGRHQKTQTISVIQYINTHYSIRQVPVTLEKWYRWSQSKQKNLEDKYLEPWRQYQAIVNPRQRSY